jgi:formylglycine-generating enzyme
MRQSIFILLLFSISLHNNTVAQSKLNNASELEFYRQYGFFTNPGEYETMYANLPDSISEICKIIKAQLIHPFGDLPQYRDIIPEERSCEDLKYPTVQTILAGLKQYNPDGLILNRKPADRLVVSCRYHAILLASILKYKGIPVRVRYGFANYLIPDYHICHAVCEVWNKNENRWMLVDPDRQKVDIPKGQFQFAQDVWTNDLNGKLESDKYGVPGWWGSNIILLDLCQDLASVLGNEHIYYNMPPLVVDKTTNYKTLSADNLALMNNIAALMGNVDGNLNELKEIYEKNKQLHLLNSFVYKGQDFTEKMNIQESCIKKDAQKPEIEWVAIPAGTFMMGSRETEIGRYPDETQHEVTLSAFKMSKYEVTFEQYSLFCEATGARNPCPMKGLLDKYPVSNITWFEATKFAEWMGCRLPTEAEFEYAARGGTITPFFSGNSLNTEQANFDKGKSEKNIKPVGSYAPNAYGLYDMTGNLWEWTSGWYGDYSTSYQSNPKGPSNGTLKVDRGGGFYSPSARCRSACRGGGTPPGNKGNGIGFRLVYSE